MGDFHALLLLAVALLAFMVVAEDGQAPVIKTTTGLISGVRMSIGGKDVDLYLGIPYAQSPTGPPSLRETRTGQAVEWNIRRRRKAKAVSTEYALPHGRDEASEQKIPVFRYVFDYRPSFSIWPAWFRASHGDDLAFDLGSLVFLGDEGKFIPGIRPEDYGRFKQLKYTASEKQFMEAMVTSVSQFVKTG
ncbi:hypothetical protein MTO96_001785 [Rhipicephalus appendiculatus]